MSEPLQLAKNTIREAGYSVRDITVRDRQGFAFEDRTIIGFCLIYERVSELLASWKEDVDRLVMEHQFALRRANMKAWNTYIVLFATSPANAGEQAALDTIEEDLTGTRKLARAVPESRGFVPDSFLPLLPFQHAPRLEAVDVQNEIAMRAGAIPPELVHAFLSSAQERLVLEMLEETQ